MLGAFVLFSPEHIGVLSTIAIVALVSILLCRKDPHSTAARSVVAVLAFFCFAVYPVKQLAALSVHGIHGMEGILPFHLCDLAAFLCGFALITRRPLLCELSYFWGLAGTMQGLLTPNLAYHFPNPVFFSFFLQHGVIVIVALLLPLGLGWRPRPGAALRAFKWVLVYAAAAMVVNRILGTNYGFLAHKPTEASLLDVMPGWPGYIFCLIALAGLLFYLLALPFKQR